MRRAVTLTGMCVAALTALGACSAALEPLEPAAPKDDPPPAVTQPEPEEPAVTLGSNPYEAGVQAAWSAELPSAPTRIAYSAQSRTLVVALGEIADLAPAQLRAYSVVGGDQVLELWDIALDPGLSVTALEIGTDHVWVNTANGSIPYNLQAIDTKTGQVSADWLRTNPLDSDVPQIVGAFGDQVGVYKTDSARIIAALMDSRGRITDSRQVFFTGGLHPLSAPEISPRLVNTAITVSGASVREDQRSEQAEQDVQAEAAAPSEAEAQDETAPEGDAAQETSPETSQEATQYVTFPELTVISGDWCSAVSDGFVCLEKAPMGSSTTDGSEGDALAVTEYDEAGHYTSQRVLDSDAAAHSLRLAGRSFELKASELSKALADPLPSAGTGKAGGADEAVSRSREVEPAILYDGEWLPESGWAAPEGSGASASEGRALSLQAPFWRSRTGGIINARTGEAMIGGGVGYQVVDARGAYLFEYSDGELAFLEPAGSKGS